MFFVIIFLCLAALGSHFFPELSGVAILGISFACVAALRLLLLLADRSKKSAASNTPS